MKRLFFTSILIVTLGSILDSVLFPSYGSIEESDMEGPLSLVARRQPCDELREWIKHLPRPTWISLGKLFFEYNMGDPAWNPYENAFNVCVLTTQQWQQGVQNGSLAALLRAQQNSSLRELSERLPFSLETELSNLRLQPRHFPLR